MDKNSSCRTLNECFGKLFEEETLTDVKFSVGGDGTMVKGHKLVLAARSPVFNAMFNGGFKDEGAVKILDATVNDFQRFMRFLYTDEVKLSMDNVSGLLYFADKYNVIILFERCIEYLAENLSIENACTVFAHAKKYNTEELTNLALDFICLHAQDCLRTDAFLQLGSDDVEDISSNESLNCREETLFESLDEWAKLRCREKEVDVTDENKRNVLGKLLFTVRFPQMPYEYIVSKLSNRQICTDAEMLQILQSHVALKENGPTTTAESKHSTDFIGIARKPLKYESVVLMKEGSYSLELAMILNEKVEDTSFTIDADTWFYGIMMYGPKDEMRFCVEIVLFDECSNSEIIRESVCVQSAENHYTCNVALRVPVYLLQERQYTCSINIYTSSSSQFYRLHESYLKKNIPKGQKEKRSSTGLSFGVQPSYGTGIVATHHDTYVEKCPDSSPPRQEVTIVKSFRKKKITVSDRSSILAGLLLY